MSELEPTSSRIGTILRGKWTLERLLGEGGMASVYVARHKIGRLDAIKILHPAIAASPQLRARFEQEAHVVNRFRHGGAVEIRDIDTSDDGAPFLVMELLEGETLSSLVRRTGRALDVPTVLRMADQVLDVLAAAHAHGIIHRDIKPDNLMLLADGRVKVLDFGIARLRERVNEDLKTRTGTTLGTVAYMPPEQAKGLEIDARADVYAVGATMFRLLANRRVHEADTEVERLMKVVTEPAPPLASAAPQVPAPVCAVVDRALAFDRDRRYADAPAMQAEVRAVMGADASPYVPPAVQAPLAAPPTAAAPQAAAPQAAPPHVEAPTVGPAAHRDAGTGAAPTRALSPQALAHAHAGEAPTRARPDEATRAAPGLVHEAATVAAPAPRSPPMLPTAATAAVAPPAALAAPLVPPVAAPAPPAPDRNRTALIAALIAGGALLVLASIAGAVALFWVLRAHSPGDSPEEPLAAPSASAAQLPPAESHATTEAPPSNRTVTPRSESPSLPPSPAPPPPQAAPAPQPPQPAPGAQPPPGHAHGHGHGHER